MKYRINSKDPKSEYEKEKKKELSQLEQVFNVDLTPSSTIRVMGVDFEKEELERMRNQPNPIDYEEPLIELEGEELQSQIDYYFHHKRKSK